MLRLFRPLTALKPRQVPRAPLFSRTPQTSRMPSFGSQFPTTFRSIFQAPSPTFTSRRETVVALVVGKVKGKEAVLIGQRKIWKTEPQPYGLPGGHKEHFDQNFTDAAIRELREETGVCLINLIQAEQVQPDAIYKHDIIVKEIFHRTVYVLFNIENHLESVTLSSDDDLANTRVVPTDRIQKINGRYIVSIDNENKPVRPTNGFLIKAWQTGKLSEKDRCELDDLSNIDRTNGTELLFSAVNKKQEGRIQYLLENGASIGSLKNAIALLKTAISQNQPRIISTLVTYGALNYLGHDEMRFLIEMTKRNELSNFAATVASAMIAKEIAAEFAAKRKDISVSVTPEKTITIKIENFNLSRDNLENAKRIQRISGAKSTLDGEGTLLLENITSIRFLLKEGEELYKLMMQPTEEERLSTRLGMR